MRFLDAPDPSMHTHDHGHHHHPHDHGHRTKSAADKLTAELTDRPDPATALVIAVDDTANLFGMAADGRRVATPLPDGWRALRVTSSARSGDVWAVAVNDKDAQRFAIWALDDGPAGWRQLHAASDDMVIEGAPDGGYWLREDAALRRHDSAGATLRRIPTDFRITDFSECSDGTLWVVGGEKRYGGAAVHRFDDTTGTWFDLPPPAAAVAIAGAPDGTSWSVSSKGELWRLSADGAGTFRECGLSADCRRCFYAPDRDRIRGLSVGADGNLWFLADAFVTGGHYIGRFTDLGDRSTMQPDPAVRATSIAATTLERYPIFS